MHSIAGWLITYNLLLGRRRELSLDAPDVELARSPLRLLSAGVNNRTHAGVFTCTTELDARPAAAETQHATKNRCHPPPPSTGAPQTPRQYPICALRKYSLYFDVLLSERWLKLQYNDNSPPAVDLSHTDLDPVACTSVLRFMVSRARSGGRDGESEDTKNGDGEHEEVTTEELKELLWDGFKWEQKDTTPNDEEKLYQVVDYLHVRHQDEILTKLWAIKMVQCPCSLEETLKKRDLVGRRRSLTDDDEEEEVYVKRVPEYRMTERMWRFLVCLFICQMLKEDEQYSTANHGRRMGTYNVLNQLSSLCSGLPENPLLLLRECVSIGLLSKEGAMYHQQTSVESQAVLLWKLLE